MFGHEVLHQKVVCTVFFQECKSFDCEFVKTGMDFIDLELLVVVLGIALLHVLVIEYGAKEEAHLLAEGRVEGHVEVVLHEFTKFFNQVQRLPISLGLDVARALVEGLNVNLSELPEDGFVDNFAAAVRSELG